MRCECSSHHVYNSALKDIRFERTSGPLGHLIRKDIWSVGASGPLRHLADDKRLALVEHLTIKGRLVHHSNTSGPKGHMKQREWWYIWRWRTHLVHQERIWYIWHWRAHLILLAQRSASGTSDTLNCIWYICYREDSSQVGDLLIFLESRCYI